MLDSRRLVTLQAVVRTGSFAAAAESLGYTQSAVSQHIAELERGAGVRLVDRRPVRPTEAGRIALRAADAAGEAIAAAETALRAFREGEAGAVRLGAFASAARAIAAPALASFRREHPAVELTLLQVEPTEAHAALIDGRLDLAVTFDDDVAPAPPPPAVERELLAEDPVLVALPHDHPLAAAASVRLGALAADPWIASPLAGLPLDLVRARVGGAFAPAVRFEGDDFRTVLALVAQGFGNALVPRLAAHGAGDGVAFRPLGDAPVRRRLYVAKLATGRPPAAATRLVGSLRAALA